MSNPWKKVSEPTDVQNLSDIMSEEYAKGLQAKEEHRFAEELSETVIPESSGISSDILKKIDESNAKEYCDSDAIIAKVLQCQFDKEHDDQIKRVAKKINGDAKVTVSYDNYRNVPEHLVYDSESDDEDIDLAIKKDWDRFETNDKEFASIPKCGFTMKEGEMITKHDSTITGRRNACKVMAFPPEVCTGDGAGFDMKLSNSVFNHLREQTKWHQTRKNKMLDRKESHATAEMGLDEPTRLILFKLINNGFLEYINGVISTGKESVVLHANTDQWHTEGVVPKEVAIKVFKTTLNEFKTRDKYIVADYRFKNRFSKQNPRKIVHMWAEKEMHNMQRMQDVGLNCPEMVFMKKHILIMSFIGKDNKPAPKLRDITLKPEKWQSVYNEVVEAMHRLYNVGRLVHADLSEYNILWWENKCWFIDVSQSVQPDHPHGLEFLMRDCRNIVKFFGNKDVPNLATAEELFKSITGFEEIDVNLLEGVHTVFNPLLSRFEIAPDDNRNVSYPFEYCWNKSNEIKKTKSDNSCDDDDDGDNGEDDDDTDEDEELNELWAHIRHGLVVDASPNVPHNQIKLDNKVNINDSFDDEVEINEKFSEEVKVDVSPTKDEVDIGDNSIGKKT